MLHRGRYNPAKPVSKFCCDVRFHETFCSSPNSLATFSAAISTKKNLAKLNVASRFWQHILCYHTAPLSEKTQSDEASPLRFQTSSHAKIFKDTMHVTMTIFDVIDDRLVERSARKKDFAGLFTSRIKNFSYRQGIPPMFSFLFLLFLLLFLALKKNRKRNTGSLIFSVKETEQKTDSQRALIMAELLSYRSGHVLIV